MISSGYLRIKKFILQLRKTLIPKYIHITDQYNLHKYCKYHLLIIKFATRNANFQNTQFIYFLLDKIDHY